MHSKQGQGGAEDSRSSRRLGYGVARFGWPRLAVAAGLCWLSGAGALFGAVTCSSQPLVNRRFECTVSNVVQTGLSGLGAYKTKLKVSFTRAGISNPTISYAFWDAGEGTGTNPATFKFRARFSDPGVWSWSTTCVAGPCSSMNGLAGQVTVVDATSNYNYLYRNGPLQTATYRLVRHIERQEPLLRQAPVRGQSDVLAAAAEHVLLVRRLRVGSPHANQSPRLEQLHPKAGWIELQDRSPRPGFGLGESGERSGQGRVRFVAGCSYDHTLEEATPNSYSRPRLALWQKFDSMVETANFAEPRRFCERPRVAGGGGDELRLPLRHQRPASGRRRHRASEPGRRPISELRTGQGLRSIPGRAAGRQSRHLLAGLRRQPDRPALSRVFQATYRRQSWGSSRPSAPRFGRRLRTTASTSADP